MCEIITNSDDLKKLQEVGYTVGVKNGRLFIHNIPILNSLGKISYTYIVSALDLIGDQTIKPNNQI